MRRLIEARVRRKELVPVALEGAGKQEHWARPESAGAVAAGRRGDAGLVHILSPFDPLIIQRKRTELFFDYDHRFEAYVPKEKRVFGYFALPVLVGDEIVAAIDLKTDRQNRKLLMQKWTWVGKGAARGGAQGSTSAASRKSWTGSSGFSWRSEDVGLRPVYLKPLISIRQVSAINAFCFRRRHLQPRDAGSA